MRTHLRPAALALAAALAAGCATTSEPPAALQEAREAYRTAQGNPHVPRFAPAELNQAGRALNEAERLWRQDADSDAMAHQAYIAEQRSHIAINAAEARTARAEIDRAGAERQSVIAEARRLEAEAESRQAQQAGERTAQQLSESKQAQEQAEQARREAERARREAEQAVSRLQKQVEGLKAQHTDRGWVLRFGSEVLFDVGEATLKPGARRAIDNLAQLLRDQSEQRIMIEGFTDNTGSSDFNLALSQQRAQAVKQAIAAEGIDPQRIETRGYGESFPVASNDTTAGRQLNRRVEVLLPGTADGGDATQVRK